MRDIKYISTQSTADGAWSSVLRRIHDQVVMPVMDAGMGEAVQVQCIFHMHPFYMTCKVLF